MKNWFNYKGTISGKTYLANLKTKTTNLNANNFTKK